MLRRCRTQAEFQQVTKLVHETCEKNKTDRWGLILSGDPWGIDDPDDD